MVKSLSRALRTAYSILSRSAAVAARRSSPGPRQGGPRAAGPEVANRHRDETLPFTYCESAAALAALVDFLVVATPGGVATRHLIDARVLGALGPNGILVNVARGSVVDEQALIEALRTGALGAAALDVFENEPVVPPALRELENVVLAPHVGSATHETRAAMGDLTVDNLLRHFAGQRVLTPVE